MLTRKNKAEKTALEEQIEDLHDQMSKLTPGSDEFSTRLAVLEKLYKIQSAQPDDRVSADTKMVVAGNLAGILLILNFERLGVVTSKALGFVLKSRP